ncbi:MAG: LCP family protein, partial [Bifidobacteriaceae bacterium]|nr:LCP family protein [Bifidobacteriaceae bacterium]
QTGPPGAYGPPATKRRHPVRRTLVTLLIICLLLAAYPLGLGLWANSKIQRLDVISDTADTPGRTYLIAGSDLRGSGGVNDPTEGARTDTIMLLHVATNGQAYLISIPRDTYAEIPGYSPNKINAAYAFGGPELLIQTVEKLTQLHIDHYVEVGFGSVTELVDAVGGVELCLDQDVDDQKSHLVWEAGCHLADGTTALAFSRMRYSDPLGDIGRIARQRQVVSAVMKKAITPKNLLWPPNQIDLIEAGTGALTVDKSTNIITLGRMLLDFRKATGPEGIQGVPTIATTDYEPGGIGSAILLDPDASAADFKAIADGTWEGNQADGAAD